MEFSEEWHESFHSDAQEVVEEPVAPTIVESEPLVSEFPDQWRLPFEGLAYIGRLSKTVTQIPGHRFVVHTLLSGEKIEVSMLARELEGTLGYGVSYRAAVVAAGLELVDDMPVETPQRAVSAIKQKYLYVTNNWHDSVVDILFEHINNLEKEVSLVLHEMGVVVLPDPLVSELRKNLGLGGD